jgi:hypothetical protein
MTVRISKPIIFVDIIGQIAQRCEHMKAHLDRLEGHTHINMLIAIVKYGISPLVLAMLQCAVSK